MKLIKIALAAALLTIGGSVAASAQTMSYAQAGALIASSCGKDIERLCPNVNLGGGALVACLAQSRAKLNPKCVTDYQAAFESVSKRAAAQTAVINVCQADARQYCNGIAAGKGHFLGCLKSKRFISANCKQALTDAGWN
jgi:Cysteine rich repeat